MKSLNAFVAGTLMFAGAVSLSPAAAHAASPREQGGETSLGVRAPRAVSAEALLALGDTTSPTAATAGEDASLAAREAAAPALETFRGGGRYIYISSGAAVVLVVVLLILLL